MAKNGSTKKSTKLLIAVCIILTILIIASAAVVIFVGFDNIKAMYYGVKYDKEQIDIMIDESATRLDDKVAEYSYIVAREPTTEEMNAVNSGEITEDQLAKIITNGVTLEHFRENNYEIVPYYDNSTPAEESSVDKRADYSAETEVPKPVEEGSKPAEEQPAGEANQQPQKTQSELDAECDEQVSQIVAKMYILRSSFTSALSGLASQAYVDYQAGGSKSDIVSNYIGQGQSLEAQCDGNVSSLMSELTGVLTKYGRTTELVDTIYETYNNEKQYTKAYCMSLYFNN